MEDNNKYADIINLPHHVSKRHPQMSLYARSAQFAPFAALTGYGDAVHETARVTSDRKEIDEEIKKVLDRKLQILQEQLPNKPKITFTYFIPDLKKDGGAYETISGIVKKIDEYNQKIILENGTDIKMLEIIDITGDIF